MKLVSVIVPVFQIEKHLDMCVKSIISQTYSNLEIILVDDGSTDKSGSMCDEYSKKDFRIKVIHKKNEGVAAARNTGLKNATGEYIMFVDSDDWIEADMIQHMIEIARDQKADIVECGYSQYDKGQSIRSNYNSKTYVLDNKEEIFFHSFTPGVPYLYKVCWGKLIRKEICDNAFFPNRTVSEDSAFCDQLLMRCERVVKIYDSYYNYRITPGSIMHSGIKPTIFETMDTVLELWAILKNDSYTYSKKFWDAFDKHISECAVGIVDQIIWRGYNPLKIQGFEEFYKKCQIAEKQLSLSTRDFKMFVENYDRWSRFRKYKLAMNRIKNKLQIYCHNNEW